MTRTLLIDADVVCYQVAMSAEVVCHWDDEEPTIHVNEEETRVRFRSAIRSMQEKLDAEAAILCLTDGANWRNAVYPLYKSNRADKRKPLLLPMLRDYALAEFKTYLRPGLEGDDCLGILATHPSLIRGDKIVCTIDKDLRTIPGEHYNWKSDERFSVTEAEADFYHLQQTLSGDPTDGYPGCPGIGSVRAAKALRERSGPCATQRQLLRGPRKGEYVVDWGTAYYRRPWEVVIAHYLRAYDSDEEIAAANALTQARVARILRHTDFNFQTKEPILWTPQ